jgi:hypothetical protein
MRLCAVVDERERRIALNEVVFREVNERIEELGDQFGLQERPLELVCECGDASCTSQIRMNASEYEEIRRDPTLFVIHPGHETAGVEELVDKRNGYHVVRKRAGGPAELAEDTNPRA